MRSTIKILILENSQAEFDKLAKILKENGYTIPPVFACDERSYINQLNQFQPNVILSEHVIGECLTSFIALDISRRKIPDIPFILVSSKVPEPFAIELLKEGISCYVMKDQLLRLPHEIEVLYSLYISKGSEKKLAQANEELLKAYETIESKNKGIMQSIIFAERIQKLTLPKIDVILKYFPEAFILNKPKDIVSGDFYWFNDTNNRFLAAVADCTGHGVSGALLSMIGSGFLNEIIENETGINNPTDILSELDANICKLLHQDINTSYQDGIDIAFCAIDQNEKIVYFSGCKRPLLYYRKKDKEIIEYKGEPYLIGGVDSRITKTFRTQEIPYKPGDIIYMFSDGYVDQFGGEHDKKLMKEQLIDWLLTFKHLNLNYQGQLLEQKLLKWKGEKEQTDDILVVGIKL